MSALTRVVLMLIGIVIIGVTLIAGLAALSRAAHARWKPQYAESAYAKWYHDQHNARGEWCCDKSDGHPYYGPYTINKDGSVTLDLGKGLLRKLPGYMVLKGPNPTGHAVWWYADAPGGHLDYCFAPGTLS